MIRFLLEHYRRLVLNLILTVCIVQVISAVIYDVGFTGLRSPIVDGFLAVYGTALFTIFPLLVAYHAFVHHRQAIPETRALAGWYLGMSANAIAGGVTAVLGLAQAGLRHFLLAEVESQTSNYLLFLLIGFLFVLWLGGVMGIVGRLVGIRVGTRSA